MTQYIDKTALVAEIEKLYNFEYYCDSYEDALGYCNALDRISAFLNTLGVKEVDLEEEINRWQGCEAFPEGMNITPLPKAMDIVERTAKHFFELGLKAAQKGE